MEIRELSSAFVNGNRICRYSDSTSRYCYMCSSTTFTRVGCYDGKVRGRGEVSTFKGLKLGPGAGSCQHPTFFMNKKFGML